MRRSRVAILVLLALFVSSPTALALVNYIAIVQGSRQGRIRGGITQKGREGAIQVLSIEHEIVSPRDAASGQATGKRQHKPIRLHVVLDQSAPRLFQAMVTGEILTDVTLRGYMSSQLAEVQHFTVQLTNAAISSIQMSSVTASSLDDEQDVIALELVYQKITWTWTDGGITAEDEWVAQQ